MSSLLFCNPVLERCFSCVNELSTEVDSIVNSVYFIVLCDFVFGSDLKYF